MIPTYLAAAFAFLVLTIGLVLGWQLRKLAYPDEHADVARFHAKFGIDQAHPPAPTHLTEDLFRYRFSFLVEELGELALAAGHEALGVALCQATTTYCRDHPPLYGVPERDLVRAFDALLDLAYVLRGTALLMGITPAHWADGWSAVERANMAKVRGVTKRGEARWDVTKPEGWVGPEAELRNILST